MNKFWSFSKNEGKRELYFSGTIAEESWLDDDITPEKFKDELFSDNGDIDIWLNSPGGDCIAASRIYAMLMDYKGNVTIKIDGIAASAASVIAMAGTEVKMAPTALMMIHNPFTVAIGDGEEMKKAVDMLYEVKESIINAYELKTGLNREELSKMMDAETWMNAGKTIELGFADKVLEDEKRKGQSLNLIFSRKAINNKLIAKISNKEEKVSLQELHNRLNLLRR